MLCLEGDSDPTGYIVWHSQPVETWEKTPGDGDRKRSVEKPRAVVAQEVDLKPPHMKPAVREHAEHAGQQPLQAQPDIIRHRHFAKSMLAYEVTTDTLASDGRTRAILKSSFAPKKRGDCAETTCPCSL